MDFTDPWLVSSPIRPQREVK